MSLVQVNAHREKAIYEIEMMAKEMRRSGATADWANVADAKLRDAAHGVNGPLLVGHCCSHAPLFASVASVCKCQECLARLVEYHDCECIDMFRVGARLLGELECSGNGRRLKPEEQGKADMCQLNRGLEKRLVLHLMSWVAQRTRAWFLCKEPADAERLERRRELQDPHGKDFGRREEGVDVHPTPAERRRHRKVRAVAEVLYCSR